MNTPIVQERWWHTKQAALRSDICNALMALRAHVENLSAKSPIILSHLSTYTQRSLTAVHTTRVGEWELGYSVRPINEDEGFYLRSVFAKLHGGRLCEISGHERQQIIDGIAAGALDEGTTVDVEFINETTFVVRQPFAVMFWNELNPNLVTPTADLILSAFDPARQLPKKEGGS